MSIVKAYSVFCDGWEASGHPCPSWTGDITDDAYRSPVIEARRIARLAGWTRRRVGDRMLDLCPGAHVWNEEVSGE